MRIEIFRHKLPLLFCFVCVWAAAFRSLKQWENISAFVFVFGNDALEIENLIFYKYRALVNIRRDELQNS